MRATVALAREHGVAVGAHPGFPDLAGFGRREMKATPREVEDLVAYQIGALAGDCRRAGRPACAREAARRAVQHGGARRWISPTRSRGPSPPSIRRSMLFGLPGSKSARGGAAPRACGRSARRSPIGPIARDGTLVPRNEPGAVIDDEEIVVARAVAMVRERVVIAADGTRVPLDVRDDLRPR